VHYIVTWEEDGQTYVSYYGGEIEKYVTEGESFYYVVNNPQSSNTRQRPYAYNIDAAHKELYDSYYFVDT